MLETPIVRKPTIGLTPLIDVVFILLIFFLLVMQFRQYQQLPLSMAAASKSQPIVAGDNKLVSVILASDDSCYVNKRQVNCEKMAERLAVKHSGKIVLYFEGPVILSRILNSHQSLVEQGFDVHLATRVKLLGGR